jgi:NAD(P)-dependent dehydrogenase (short-subunit alcohol dehydrogenase family)
MAAEIVGPGVAAAVPVEAGEGIGPAGLKLPAENIAIGHGRTVSPIPAGAAPRSTPGGAPVWASMGRIAWLCSDAASYVTGAILDVTGGR